MKTKKRPAPKVSESVEAESPVAVARSSLVTAEPVEGFITKKEIARRLKREPRTIERWMRDQILPFIKIGKGRRGAVLFSWPVVQHHLATRFGVAGK